MFEYFSWLLIFFSVLELLKGNKFRVYVAKIEIIKLAKLWLDWVVQRRNWIFIDHDYFLEWAFAAFPHRGPAGF